MGRLGDKEDGSEKTGPPRAPPDKKARSRPALLDFSFHSCILTPYTIVDSAVYSALSPAETYSFLCVAPVLYRKNAPRKTKGR